jgi:prepilin signal peptidase PulO-like enzyme (type II secretory pathway)
MIAYLVFVFILGSAVGSFLNVVADRVVHGESILGWSYCDHCHTTLSVLDLVPIISFVGLGARCRYCHRKISLQYPIVEFITASLFVLAFWVLATSFTLTISTLAFWLFLISILVVVAIVDFKYYLVPTTLVYFASLVALFFAYFAFTQSVFLDHVLAAFAASAFFGLVVILSRGRGMGFGDVVLAFLMGLILGMEGTLTALFIAFLLGAFVAVILVALRRKKFGQVIPFAPFLVIGIFASMFFTSQIVSWYLGMLY